MPIKIKVASSLDILAESIINELSSDRPGVFEKERIITQTEGINNWLRYRIAETTGIAANIEFTKMNDVLMLLYYRLCPGGPQLIERDVMAWTIFSIIDTDEFKTLFPEKAAYFHQNEVKRAALAEEMADLYDQYQIYRDDEIKEWNKNSSGNSDEYAWQSWIWITLKSRLGDKYADRTIIAELLMHAINNPDKREIMIHYFPRLRFFGLAILTPYYLRLFYELSKYIDVEFYLTNPCPEILWMDDLSAKKIAALRNRPALLEYKNKGNEMLINWGSVLRNTYRLLLTEDVFINAYETLEEPPTLDQQDTLLKKIQYEIKQNISNDERVGFDMKQMGLDNSITINGCFTPAREVEVLYNYILDRLSEDSEIGSRDILVMVSDIDRYAPFIKAVFENSPVYIPYTIADESVAGGNSMFSSIKDILSININSFTSEQVLSLLDNSYVRRKFEFEDLHAVREAVRESGIYFGTKQAVENTELWNQTEAWMVSWEYGLQKIMYGLCMSGENHYEADFHGFYPLDTAEGSDMLERVRLLRFVETLKKVLLSRNQNRSLEEWATYLSELVNDLILDADDHDDDDYPQFVQILENITGLHTETDGIISFSTFRYIFLNKLSQEKRTSRFGSRGITFCSLLPMRSVPFDVIALLGMDFNKFPRKDSALSFSLLSKESRLGDRSIRENDKHLLLETLLSVRKKLYISFLARDVQDGSELPPSILVDEFINYIAEGFSMDTEAFKKEFITIHPLHLFSKKYLEDSRKLNNYLFNSLVQSAGLLSTETTIESKSIDFSSISLSTFASFFKHPIKHFFNKKHDIYYFDENERLPEHEVFEMDSIGKWKIKNELLSNFNQDQILLDRNKKKGDLPLSNMGAVVFNELKQEVSAYRELLNDITNGLSPSELEVYLPLTSGSVIKGRLTSVYGDKYVYISFSTNVLKHIVEPWVNYLVTIMQPHAPVLDFYYLYIDQRNNAHSIQIHYDQIDKKAAGSLIDLMLDFYVKGHEQMISFYPPLSGEIFSNIDEDIDKLKQYCFRQAASTNNGRYDPVFSDVYFQKAIESGLLEDSNISLLKQNTIDLLSLLKDLCPKIFVSKKKI